MEVGILGPPCVMSLQTSRAPLVAPGFERVEAAFRANFERYGEVGSACAVYYCGNPVVDLWGGIRDVATGAPWDADTIVWPVSSTTKGMKALAVAVANSRGAHRLRRAGRGVLARVRPGRQRRDHGQPSRAPSGTRGVR